MDPSALQIVRDQAKNVNFKEDHDVIPVSKVYPSYLESCGMEDNEEEEEEEENRAGQAVVEQEPSGSGSHSLEAAGVDIVSNGRSSGSENGSLLSYSSSVRVSPFRLTCN